MSSRTSLIEALRQEGIQDEQVLAAMLEVPRDAFVSADLKSYAFANDALPIDCGQTISQPYVVARMIDLVFDPTSCHQVLEVGTGSGYQAAVLSQLFDNVYTVERIKQLLDQATKRFTNLNYSNIQSQFSDGFEGWSEHAPYDAILVSAAAPEVPGSLLAQLVDEGRMVVPVDRGERGQFLQLVVRRGDDFDVSVLDPVVFVPMLEGKVD